MTIALDTTVLVRYLTWDDVAQAGAAARIIESGETLAVSTVVLCERAWVPRRSYRLATTEIADALQYVIESRNVELDRPVAGAGLHMLRGGGDFADGVIQHDAARAKCRGIATFDQSFADHLGEDRAILLRA